MAGSIPRSLSWSHLAQSTGVACRCRTGHSVPQPARRLPRRRRPVNDHRGLCRPDLDTEPCLTLCAPPSNGRTHEASTIGQAIGQAGLNPKSPKRLKSCMFVVASAAPCSLAQAAIMQAPSEPRRRPVALKNSAARRASCSLYSIRTATICSASISSSGFTNTIRSIASFSLSLGACGKASARSL